MTAVSHPQLPDAQIPHEGAKGCTGRWSAPGRVPEEHLWAGTSALTLVAVMTDTTYMVDSAALYVPVT